MLMNRNEIVQDVITSMSGEEVGKISDGYHTFEELYYHRMILFAVICNTHPKGVQTGVIPW